MVPNAKLNEFGQYHAENNELKKEILKLEAKVRSIESELAAAQELLDSQQPSLSEEARLMLEAGAK